MKNLLLSAYCIPRSVLSVRNTNTRNQEQPHPQGAFTLVGEDKQGRDARRGRGSMLQQGLELGAGKAAEDLVTGKAPLPELHGHIFRCPLEVLPAPQTHCLSCQTHASCPQTTSDDRGSFRPSIPCPSTTMVHPALWALLPHCPSLPPPQMFNCLSFGRLCARCRDYRDKKGNTPDLRGLTFLTTSRLLIMES